MPSTTTKLALAAGAFAAKAYAHGLVQGFAVDGEYQQGFILDYYYEKINSGSYPDVAGWYEEATDNGFVTPDAYGTADIICHKNAENAKSTATVAAGGTVDFYWTGWPDSHFGPVLTYVANCGEGADACSTVDKTTLEWVKIDEAGIDISTQTWAATDLIANNNTWSVTVPETLAAGSYVFRHEIIAMHGAGSENGAQNYPFCINIAITGSGTDSPAGTLGTELYTSTDPGILFEPYGDITEYTIPGPALYSGASSSGGSSSGGSSSGGSSSTGSSATGSGSGSTPAATGPASTPTNTGSPAAAPTSTGSASSADEKEEEDEYEESGCGSSRRRRRHARDMARFH